MLEGLKVAEASQEAFRSQVLSLKKASAAQGEGTKSLRKEPSEELANT